MSVINRKVSVCKSATILILDRYAQLKKASRTNSTFGFCRHESQRRKNQKSCFLPTLEKMKIDK
jgi:hypothetical protein